MSVGEVQMRRQKSDVSRLRVGHDLKGIYLQSSPRPFFMSCWPHPNMEMTFSMRKSSVVSGYLVL